MISIDEKPYKLLATTALESTWGSKEELVFLGEWCKKFSRERAYKNRIYTVLNYHWLDRNKIKNALLKPFVNKLEPSNFELRKPFKSEYYR